MLTEIYGSATTININRASSSFTHTITYSFSGLTGTIATKTNDTSIGWTIPTSFYAKIPNEKSGKVTITCDTYSGNTKVGTKTTTANVFVINSEPTVDATVQDVNSSTVALTGDSNKLIRYMSNAKVDITATAKNSATIKSRKVVCGNKSGTSASNTLNNVESGTFEVSCTDSRGFSASKTITKTLVEYIKLAFTNVSLTRPTTTSNTVNAVVKGNYFNSNFGTTNNTFQMKYRYRQSGGEWSSYQTISATITNNTFNFSASLGDIYNFNNEYEFEFVITDKLMNVTQKVTVTRGIPIIDIGENDVIVNGEVYPESCYVGDEKVDVEKSIIVNQVTTANTDLDDYIKTGMYYFSGTYTPEHIPAGSNGWLKVMRTNNNIIKQIWYRYGTANTNDYQIYVRTKFSEGWSTWRRLQAGDIVLYENNSGSTGTITLSDTAENYYYLEIFYRNNDGFNSSTKVPNPNGKDVVLVSTNPANTNGNAYLKSTQLSISGTKITPEKYSEVSMFTGGDLSINTSTNRISIVKVLGWI